MPALSLLPIEHDDLPFVRTMLYEAAFWREVSTTPPIEEALRQPSLAVYVNEWGRPGDQGLIARISGKPVGAVWVRLFNEASHGYGYVDHRTPELSLAVVKDHRRRGIGRCLMVTMLAQARLDGVFRISLSVELDNPARSLYESIGFVPEGAAAGAVTMVGTLR